jgi:hypothetical protein
MSPDDEELPTNSLCDEFEPVEVGRFFFLIPPLIKHDKVKEFTS